MGLANKFKLKLPRGDDNSVGKMIRRGHFLDGSVRCFLGPGQQRWDYGKQWYLDQYTRYTIPYEGTTDWVEAGRLLEVPQVVFFGLNVVEPSIRGDYYSYLPGQTIYYPPSGRDENLRLISLMDSVKDRIESIRHGRTFVTNALWDPVVWVPESSAIGTIYRFSYVQPAYQSLGKTTAIVVPPSEYPDHIKTDLLVISVGASLDVRSLPETHPLYSYRIYSANVGSVEFPPGGSVEESVNYVVNYSGKEGDHPYQESLDLMKSGYDKFPRYAAKLYGYHTNLADPDSLSFFQNSHPLTYDGIQLLADDFYAYKAWIETAARSFVQKIAEDLSNFGYSYMGESGSLDEDSLVGIISSHFGFDPKTGYDLPISQS